MSAKTVESFHFKTSGRSGRAMTEGERRRALKDWWMADEESEILPAERAYGSSLSALTSQRLILAAGIAAAVFAGALYF